MVIFPIFEYIQHQRKSAVQEAIAASAPKAICAKVEKVGWKVDRLSLQIRWKELQGQIWQMKNYYGCETRAQCLSLMPRNSPEKSIYEQLFWEFDEVTRQLQMLEAQ